MQATYIYKTISSPVGRLRLVASDKGLCALLFNDGGDSRLVYEAAIKDDNHPILVKAEKQLDDYFAGRRQAFDIKLDMQGTVFQIKSWKELQKIPYGTTVSYGEQARRVGDANKARAVGMANNRNPIAIIVPCHRVIGADGKLVGFGGGLLAKEYLLALERQTAALAA